MDAPGSDPHFLSRPPLAFLQRGQRPPRGVIWASVILSGVNGHWWWDDALNDAGEAVLQWSPQHGVGRGACYPVVWFLYLSDVGPLSFNGRYASQLRNTCGFVRCVNPRHWHHVTPEARRAACAAKVVTYDGEGRPIVRLVRDVLRDADKPRDPPKR